MYIVGVTSTAKVAGLPQVPRHRSRLTIETIHPYDKAPRRTLLFGSFTSFAMTVTALRSKVAIMFNQHLPCPVPKFSPQSSQIDSLVLMRRVVLIHRFILSFITYQMQNSVVSFRGGLIVEAFWPNFSKTLLGYSAFFHSD